MNRNFIAVAIFVCGLNSLAHGQIAPADLKQLPESQAGPATAFLNPGNSATRPDLPVQEKEPRPASTHERYLLKSDNSIIAGVIDDAGESYCVNRGGSKMFIPKSMVQTVANATSELYKYRANRIPVRDLSLRVSLAQWCFDQGMTEFAIAESQLVLAQDPGNVIALRIQKLCAPKAAASDNPYRQINRKKLPQPDPRQVISQFKSAYGNDLFEDFTEMHSLLIVSCGKGSCHGTRHEGAFKLYRRLEAPGDVKLTSRNLMSLLNSIDYREPLKSPVLYKALERHGSSTLPPLGGVQDPTYVKLQEWVLEVSRRWAGNEIEMDPRRMAPVDEIEAESDEVFAGGRPERQPLDIVVRRTARPEMPVLEPGDDIAKIRSGPPLADDAPPAKTPAPDRTVKEQPNSSPNDPYSPAGFNRGSSSGTPQRRSFDSSRVIEMKDGRPVVKQTISLPGIKDGTTFEAAAPPFGLRAATRPVNSRPPQQNVNLQPVEVEPDPQAKQ